jgi:catechol 2,3-dioxygenase-like lactoylglutathione lyase family enzyme
MFDHIGLLVRDSKVSLPFFTACLKPLGIERVQDRPEFDAAIFMIPGTEIFMFVGGIEKGAPSFWRTRHVPGGAPAHLAFVAPSREAVDAFYKAALEHSGRDNGPPGMRKDARRKNGSYAAFVLDPDNNNVEASWRLPDAIGRA